MLLEPSSEQMQCGPLLSHTLQQVGLTICLRSPNVHVAVLDFLVLMKEAGKSPFPV